MLLHWLGLPCAGGAPAACRELCLPERACCGAARSASFVLLPLHLLEHTACGPAGTTLAKLVLLVMIPIVGFTAGSWSNMSPFVSPIYEVRPRTPCFWLSAMLRLRKAGRAALASKPAQAASWLALSLCARRAGGQCATSQPSWRASRACMPQRLHCPPGGGAGWLRAHLAFNQRAPCHAVLYRFQHALGKPAQPALYNPTVCTVPREPPCRPMACSWARPCCSSCSLASTPWGQRQRRCAARHAGHACLPCPTLPPAPAKLHSRPQPLPAPCSRLGCQPRPP